MAAAAALMNANELCAEAELLAENGHKSRAAALAVIGLEEFAKSVAYTAAAIFPEQSSGLQDRLNDHNVKHWIAAAFDGPQIVTSDKESLRNTFRELLKSKWGSFVLTRVSAKEATKKSQEFLNDPQLHVLTSELITTPLIKNAALYVDIEEGKVLSPSRIDRYANYEIQGLIWCLDHTRLLLEILPDDKQWEWFAKPIRQTSGAGLSIEKGMQTPKKTAIKTLKRLSVSATWDQIKKEIEKGAQDATEERERT